MLPDRTAYGWPLVGRGGELDLIHRCRERGDSAAVVTGAAGVGKSRLARETLALFAGQGAQTRWVQATRSAANVPLGAFASVLPGSVRSADPLELLRRSTDALSELGGAGPLVLGVDDAHLLDPSSAALVLDLTLRTGVFVVATVRAGEPCPDAITSVWKDGGATRVELGALDRAQTEALAEHIAGGPIELSARRWIHQTSQGNALYVRELTRGALASGALAEVRGLWRMPAQPPVSATLTELISARLTGLDPAPARALELLALGEPLPAAELASLAGGQAVAEAETRGLAVVSGAADAAEVSLSHPLYGEVIRAGLPTFRRHQIQLELAAAIQRRARIHDRDLIRMARWLTGAGREVPLPALLDAAAAANLAGDPGLAAELAGHAVAAGGGLGAAVLLGRAYALQGRYAAAEEVLAAAEDRRTDQATAVSYLEVRAAVLYWGLRRPGQLQDLLTRARSWWDQPGWHQQLDSLPFDGPDGPSYGASVQATAEIYTSEAADPEARRRIAPFHVANLFFSGRTAEAFELAGRIRPTVPLKDLADEMAFVLWGVIALESGQGWAELEEWAPAALALSIRCGDHGAAGQAALALGGLRFSQGRFHQAGRLLAEAELQLEQHDAGRLLAIVASMQVGVACFTGDLAAAGPALERCRAAFAGGEPLPHELPHVARADAWACLARGDPPRAQALLLDAADRLPDMPVYAARLTYEALRAGGPPRRLAPRLQQLAGRSDARLTAAYAAHATARVTADGDSLWAVADEMEAIGALRYATEAAAHAASAYLGAGRQDAARRAAARCHDLHARGDGGTAPVIDGLAPGSVVLTPRERQLTSLAARGLSNAEIADQLVLSVRTVESHLYRAMHKLGVTDRRQLPSP